MGRVRSMPVEVRVGDHWYRGTLRSCEVAQDGSSCVGDVDLPAPRGIETRRIPASRMRRLSGEQGCPADHVDRTCGGCGGTVTEVGQVHTYALPDGPDVEVLVEGVWHAGMLRGWRQHEDLTWWAEVQWSSRPGRGSSLHTTPAHCVRPA